MKLISDDYREQQSQLHANNPSYGIASQHFAPVVASLAAAHGATELLDYGAGKGRLGEALAVLMGPACPKMHHYEPAFPAWASTPAAADMVACIDVLEHVEPECLDAVLDDLARVTRRIGIFTVHTGKAVKTLPDGRNAHLIQQPAEWWLPRLMERFRIALCKTIPNGFLVVVNQQA